MYRFAAPVWSMSSAPMTGLIRSITGSCGFMRPVLGSTQHVRRSFLCSEIIPRRRSVVPAMRACRKRSAGLRRLLRGHLPPLRHAAGICRRVGLWLSRPLRKRLLRVSARPHRNPRPSPSADAGSLEPLRLSSPQLRRAPTPRSACSSIKGSGRWFCIPRAALPYRLPIAA